MQNTCINRKGKQRKSSVRRGARKEKLTKKSKKEQNRLLLLGFELHHLHIQPIYDVFPHIPYMRGNGITQNYFIGGSFCSS